MPAVTRQFCLAVLIAFLISHAAFAAHIVTHPLADPADCQLCTGQSNAVPVSPVEPVALPPAPSVAVIVPTQPSLPAQPLRLVPGPRAPPPSNR